jgi:FMN phosphatase YigB (HAD superfamily)
MLLPIDNQMISAVLFDAGGTLVHVDYQVIVDLADARGYRVDSRAIRLAEAAERIAIDRRSEASGGAIGADASRVGRYSRGLLATSDIPVETAAEIALEVEAVHRAEKSLEAAGLSELLEFVLDSHFEGVEKPDPEIFRRALQRLGLPPERVVYIGDIYSIDAVGARCRCFAGDHRPDKHLPWTRLPDHSGPARIDRAGRSRKELR